LPPEPQARRTVAFIDGQNLFHAARQAFGYTYPNYDVAALAQTLCGAQGWWLKQVRFYTGIPDRKDDAFWNHFWTAKAGVMGRQGVYVYSRSLRYRTKNIRLPDGSTHSVLTGEEKGIDVRIALDIVLMAYRGEYDIALILSQDQDLSEVAREIRAISRAEHRWIKAASAFPCGEGTKDRRGIDRTDWIRIDRAMYDHCLDRRDYRPRRPGGDT
jgi:uncharacterized LabA/DUF88 family protein